MLSKFIRCYTNTWLKALSSNVKISNDLTTSIKGVDIGSAFFYLQCLECNTIIGKRYKTTSNCLDYIRDWFTLDMSTGDISIYQLGSNNSNNSNNYNSHTSNDTNNDNNNEISNNTTINGLELAKLQTVLLNHEDRLNELEDKLKQTS